MMEHLRTVPTITHALLDHLTAIVLIVSPWILDYHMVRGAAVNSAMVFGGCLAACNLLTAHELGLYPLLSMRRHFQLDVILGVLLAASPWLLGFHDRVYLPHVIAGSIITLLPLFSVRRPFDGSIYTEVVIRAGKAEVIRYARSSESSGTMGPWE